MSFTCKVSAMATQAECMQGPITTSHLKAAAPAHTVTDGQPQTGKSPTMGRITSCFCATIDSGQSE